MRKNKIEINDIENINNRETAIKPKCESLKIRI